MLHVNAHARMCVHAVCSQFFQRAWIWEAYERAYAHGPATHYLFIPKPFRAVRGCAHVCACACACVWMRTDCGCVCALDVCVRLLSPRSVFCFL
jgi:hypothetical protein